MCMKDMLSILVQSEISGYEEVLDTLRQDDSGLHLIDVHQTDSRIRVVAQFLENFESDRILVVSARQYGQRPARKFAQSRCKNILLVDLFQGH